MEADDSLAKLLAAASGKACPGLPAPGVPVIPEWGAGPTSFSLAFSSADRPTHTPPLPVQSPPSLQGSALYANPLRPISFSFASRGRDLCFLESLPAVGSDCHVPALRSAFLPKEKRHPYWPPLRRGPAHCAGPGRLPGPGRPLGQGCLYCASRSRARRLCSACAHSHRTCACTSRSRVPTGGA